MNDRGIRAGVGGIVDRLRAGRETIFQNEIAIRIAELAVRFAVSAILSGGKIFGDYSPFGAGWVGAAGAGTPGIVSAIGAFWGYLSSRDILHSIKYIGIILLIVTAAFVFKNTKFYAKTWFMPAVVSFMTACIGFVYVLDSGFAFSHTVFYVAEVVLAGASAYFYRLALSPFCDTLGSEERMQRMVSILLLITAVLSSLARIFVLADMSVGRIMALFLIMAAAYKGGAGNGAVVGVAAGISIMAALGDSATAIIYACTGMLSGVFSRRGKLSYTVIFVLIHTASALLFWNDTIALFYEMFVAAVFFILVPTSVLPPARGLLSGEFFGTNRLKRYTSERVDKIAQSFEELYETVKNNCGADKNDNDIASVFDAAAEKICRDCSMSGRCWTKEYNFTVNAMNDASRAMMKNGVLTERDLPEHFRNRCIELRSLIDEINTQLKAMLYRRQYKNRLKENKNTLYEQYMDMSMILNDISQEIGSDAQSEPRIERRLNKYLDGSNIAATAAVFRDKSGRLHIEIEGPSVQNMENDEQYLDKLSAAAGVRLCRKLDEGSSMTLLEAEPLAACVGIASARKKGEVVSGDKGTYFKTDEGELCIILSDGAGSGREAERESRDAVHILESFLKAGIKAETALKILNSVMLLRSEDDPGCATVDLLCIDLFTGRARVYKYGAAASYIRRGGIVKRISTRSLAAGLSADPSRPELIKFRLGKGDWAIVASDGVSVGGDDDWLMTLLQDREAHSAKDMAMAIIEQAMERYHCDDDMTVLAVALEERK